MNDLLTQERIPHETNVPTLPQAVDNTLSEDTISDLFNTRDQVRDNARDRARGPVSDPKPAVNLPRAYPQLWRTVPNNLLYVRPK